LGNLDNKRDYILIEDAVKKYVLIMESGKTGECYNVGSGKSLRISDILDGILKENDLDMNCVSINNLDNRIDIKDIYADVKKVRQLEYLKNGL